MASTGLFFVFYVLMHMYGNLKILSSHEDFNTYAHHLRTMFMPILPYGGLLWIFRFLLVFSLLGHLYSAFTLWARGAGARPSRYVAKKWVWETPAMRWGGIFLLLFIGWHLFQFTIAKPAIKSGVDAAAYAEDPARMVVDSFSLWWMVLLYLLALLALGLHLEHGVFSAQQTLGWTQTKGGYRRAKMIAHAVAGIVAIGFAIPPLAILFGLVK